MSNQLCRCATECEWKPEHYSLEHHPDCKAGLRRLSAMPGIQIIEQPDVVGIDWEWCSSDSHDALKEMQEAHITPRSFIDASFTIEGLVDSPILEATKSECTLTLNGVQFLVRVDVGKERLVDRAVEVDCTFEILDVLAPPEARKAWLKEKEK